MHQFTSDNICSIEFDPAGCSVKDLAYRRVLVRCNSAGPLYPLRLPLVAALVAGSSPPCHLRLGHPGHEVMAKLASVIPSCNKELSKSLCHACQLGPINSIHYFPAISIAYIDHPPSSSSTDNFFNIECRITATNLLKALTHVRRTDHKEGISHQLNWPSSNPQRETFRSVNGDQNPLLSISSI